MKDLLYKPLKIKEDANNVFVWSDLHLGHDKEFLWGPRGFNSVEEHDAAIKERWYSTLNEQSTIFILGDIMFGHNADKRLRKFLEDVPFRSMFLMGGNHHAGFKQLLNDTIESGVLWLDVSERQKYVQFIPNYIEAYIGGLFWVMSHYPILSANGQGKWNFGGMIHGHSHGNLYNNDYAKQIYNGRVIDVGVENVSEPISFHKLKKMFDKKPVVSFDHHDSKTQYSV